MDSWTETARKAPVQSPCQRAAVMDVKEGTQRKGPHGPAVSAAQNFVCKIDPLYYPALNRWTCRDPGSCHKIQASTVSVGQRSCQDLLPAQSSGFSTKTPSRTLSTCCGSKENPTLPLGVLTLVKDLTMLQMLTEWPADRMQLGQGCRHYSHASAVLSRLVA